MVLMPSAIAEVCFKRLEAGVRLGRAFQLGRAFVAPFRRAVVALECVG
jgi:hypothetical protein